MKKKKFDLIIIDWLMPFQNGDEVLRKISESQVVVKGSESHSMGVVIYSGLSADKINQEPRNGLDILDCWQKPIDHGDIFKKVQKVIQKISSTKQWRYS